MPQFWAKTPAAGIGIFPAGIELNFGNRIGMRLRRSAFAAVSDSYAMA
jgi:hypothetical protein